MDRPREGWVSDPSGRTALRLPLDDRAGQETGTLRTEKWVSTDCWTYVETGSGRTTRLDWVRCPSVRRP